MLVSDGTIRVLVGRLSLSASRGNRAEPARLLFTDVTGSIPCYVSASSSRESLPIILPHAWYRTHFADRAFRCSAPAVWNSLNTDTLCCSSLALFKRNLKKFLFRQTFRPSSSCITRL